MPSEVIPANVLAAVERQGDKLDSHFEKLIEVQSSTQRELHDLATAIRLDHEHRQRGKLVGSSNGSSSGGRERDWSLIAAVAGIMFGLLTPVTISIVAVNSKIDAAENRVHAENNSILKQMREDNGRQDAAAKRDNEREEQVIHRLGVIETNDIWHERLIEAHMKIVDRNNGP
tara:strand:+ start:8094 stop:8612 length:519 start_codon:yes stop_codon:yes gene_type:complete